jgi:hypothetical protein
MDQLNELFLITVVVEGCRALTFLGRLFPPNLTLFFHPSYITIKAFLVVDADDPTAPGAFGTLALCPQEAGHAVLLDALQIIYQADSEELGIAPVEPFQIGAREPVAFVTELDLAIHDQ